MRAGLVWLRLARTLRYVDHLARLDLVGDDATTPDAAFRAQAATSACLAAMHTALTRWAEDDGQTKNWGCCR
ncbi:hypothetical protein [Streptomyces yanii]|uniref:Uncharacterized protein n=1 Tax=Streptomyces yanii TaxID=78510 RepID=A0ABV5RA61_9ACTN